MIGALAAAGVLFVIAVRHRRFDVADGFAANGFDDLSPGGYDLARVLRVRGGPHGGLPPRDHGRHPQGATAGTAALAIGLALTLIHLISIPVTNTSVNPARSTSQAMFAGGDYIEQLWLFWVAPIIGGVLGALVYRVVLGVPEEDIDAPVTGDPDQAVG